MLRAGQVQATKISQKKKKTHYNQANAVINCWCLHSSKNSQHYSPTHAIWLNNCFFIEWATLFRKFHTVRCAKSVPTRPVTLVPSYTLTSDNHTCFHENGHNVRFHAGLVKAFLQTAMNEALAECLRLLCFNRLPTVSKARNRLL